MRDVNNFNKIKISIASPERIIEWSCGEVKKPETINYRTLKPERDGLFCEKIFGTTKEWECYCGKFKGIRYKGILCDRCGVEVAHFKSRRERLGHIQLASPVSHIWYYKSVPSRISLLLGISVNELRSVLYFEQYIVIDPGDSDLKVGQLIGESEYQNFKKQYGINFQANIGAAAIKTLLERFDLQQAEHDLREKMNEKKEKTDPRLLKRLEVIVDLKNSGNKPENMIMDVIPVIPPELRPMVQLDGGRFATSDLNDLYRRIINRNNRLKRLTTLKAPEIIIRNEKRMLQESVDALFDNSRRKRVLKGIGNRPLKSLSDMLKGKQGRFRQNLLGKRVDYSGRSVIVVGPKLKLHQCGIPKQMALELFKPFIMHGLVEQDLVYNIKSAKQMVEEGRPEIWGILEKVITKHPVLLNRAPTLHRLGIQAFEPVLVEGKAIQLHPLVCHAFNADFDGDQMAIHVPLSIEAQIESWFLMLSVHNLLNPANGETIVSPTQDMVLGINYLTKERRHEQGEGKYFSGIEEVYCALEAKVVMYQARVFVANVKGQKGFLETTPGRIILNEALPKDMEYINQALDDKMLGEIIVDIIKRFGVHEATLVLDQIKEIGFKYATYFGATIGIADICIPSKKKELIESADLKVKKIEENYQNGYLTEDERYNQVIDVWTRVNDTITDMMMNELKIDQNGFNPLYVMADSGARGSKQQIRQLASMRGLMAKPSGEILELPIKSNFKEGLTVLEYFISTHGARKGLADTALKTADAGYLTRRLVDISQDVVVGEIDCKTIKGIEVSGISASTGIKDSNIQRIIGRCASESIMHPKTQQLIVAGGGYITEDLALRIQKSGLSSVRIRTVSTCESRKSVCTKCYGQNLATGKEVGTGEAIGIIAAQSIGQPGTQLTMRTFHIGGTAAQQIEEQEINFNYSTIIKELPKKLIPMKDYAITPHKGELFLEKVIKEYKHEDFAEVLVETAQKLLIGDSIGKLLTGEEVKSEHNCTVKIQTHKKHKLLLLISEVQRVELKSGTRLFHYKPGLYIPKNTVLAEFDTYHEPILSEYSGKIKFQDIIIGSTLKIEKSDDTAIDERIITEVRDGSLTPRIIIINEKGDELASLAIPGGAHLVVEEGQEIKAGNPIAKITRAQTKTRDITGGLPRISELFEARKSKDACVISEQNGIIRFVKKQKGKVIFNVESEVFDHKTGETKSISLKHVIPSNKRLLIRDGDYVKAGDQLCDGPINLHDMLRIEGVPKLQEYLVNEVQEVYRLQGVNIHEKHIEVIIRQMLRKVEITDTGDTDFIIGQEIDTLIFQDTNKAVIEEGGKPATAQPILQGITKAALNIESFISAASFQETTKVLTNAAIKGSMDALKGLKENVIIGHLIPAGTGRKD